MYTFRKIKLPNWTKPQWYLCPNTIIDVIDHFNVVCKREISAACKEYIQNAVMCDDGSLYHPHPDTPFGVSVDIFATSMGMPWIQAAIMLENQTMQDRVNSFRDPKCLNMYLADNMTWIAEYDGMNIDIIEEHFSNDMEFPIETIYKYSDIRTMKWDIPGMSIRGTHWYAKVDKFDVIDKDGRMKWNTEKEAMDAGIWWVDKYNHKAAMDVKYVHGQRYVNGEKA